MDPIAFKIGSLPIHWYGIFLASGFLLGMWTATLRGQRDGLDPEALSNLMVWVLLGALVGAKLLYVIDEWGGGQPLSSLLFQRAGLVFQGALIGGVGAIYLYQRKHQLPLWCTLDAVAPSIALGYCLGRLGCFMTGCCHGKACAADHVHSLSGKFFSSGQIVWADSAPWLALMYEAKGKLSNLPLYPTQLYESLSGLVLYLGLSWLHRRKQFDGQVFALYLMAYSLFRFLIEFFRGDRLVRVFNDQITQGQIISVVMIIGGVWLWRRLARTATAS